MRLLGLTLAILTTSAFLASSDSLISFAACEPGFSLIDTVEVQAYSPLTAVDLDSDGDVDLAGFMWIAGDAWLSWWENRFPEEFVRHDVAMKYGEAITVGDLDEDGDEDLIFGSYGLFWYENLGNGSFVGHTVHANIRIGDGYQWTHDDLYAVDLDADGKLDIVADAWFSDPDSSEYAWTVFKNNGSGSFTRFSSLEIPGVNRATYAICLVDLDQDDDLDVVMPGDTLGPILWWENLGAMQFLPDTIPSPYPGVTRVIPADLDSDFDVDLIVSTGGSGWGSPLYWMENIGALNWSPHQVSPEFWWMSSAGVLDLDSDGDTDFYSNLPFSWWENDGSENFIEHILPVEDNTSHTILAADVDGNCRVDLVASYGRIVWWPNECTTQGCTCHTDPMCDSVTNVQDIVLSVNSAFRGVIADLDADCSWDRVDVNCSGSIDVVDVVKMVNVAFRGATVESQFCSACPK